MHAVAAQLRSMTARGKVALTKVSGRTLVQATVLDDDAHDLVELLHAYGYVANPLPGSDVIEVQIAGQASHKVLLGGDNTADALADLQPGESGLSRGGQQLIQRITGTEIVAALLQWGPARAALKRLVQEEFVALFNAHTHPGIQPGSGTTGVTTTPMTASHLTGGM